MDALEYTGQISNISSYRERGLARNRVEILREAITKENGEFVMLPTPRWTFYVYRDGEVLAQWSKTLDFKGPAPYRLDAGEVTKLVRTELLVMGEI